MTDLGYAIKKIFISKIRKYVSSIWYFDKNKQNANLLSEMDMNAFFCSWLHFHNYSAENYTYIETMTSACRINSF